MKGNCALHYVLRNADDAIKWYTPPHLRWCRHDPFETYPFHEGLCLYPQGGLEEVWTPGSPNQNPPPGSAAGGAEY
jgi:hypothetical protein